MSKSVRFWRSIG